MVWRPTAAGPRNLRELYHWVWNNFKDVGENITGEGGGITHESTTGRDAEDSHPTSAITGLDTKQAEQDQALADTQNFVINTFVPAGYGGIYDPGPRAMDLGAAYLIVNFSEAVVDSPVGVDQDFPQNGLIFESEGVWLVSIHFTLSGHNSSNAGRTTYGRLRNTTQGVNGNGIPVGIGRNQEDTNFSIVTLQQISAGAVGDVFKLQLGGGDTITGGSLVGTEFSVAHVSQYYGEFP